MLVDDASCTAELGFLLVGVLYTGRVELQVGTDREPHLERSEDFG